jgi:hypothetical protein
MDSTTFENIKIRQIINKLKIHIGTQNINKNKYIVNVFTMICEAKKICKTLKDTINSDQRLLIIMASILFGTDDENCSKIMDECLFTEQSIREVIYMISIDGNSKCELWYKIPYCSKFIIDSRRSNKTI